MWCESWTPRRQDSSSPCKRRFLDSDHAEVFFREACGWFAVIVVLAVFNTVLGEELLSRRLLLPRMWGVFGKGDLSPMGC
jgi:membrane protease YdiL (CAAX protease family)